MATELPSSLHVRQFQRFFLDKKLCVVGTVSSSGQQEEWHIKALKAHFYSDYHHAPWRREEQGQLVACGEGGDRLLGGLYLHGLS